MSEQQLARYTYLGPEGTFTEAALRAFVGSEHVRTDPSTDVVSALDAVRGGRADFAVVPMENSVEGGVNVTLDTLASSAEPLVIVGEVVVPVAFVLAVVPGTALSQVRRVSTHPHAWAQCRGWVGRELDGAVHVPATSTAAAAAILADRGREAGFDAALCSALSAERYGLEALAEGVADNPHAVTRFVVVSRPGTLPEPTGADKTTLMAHLPDNEAGALLDMLEQFAVRGVNLSRIESRPIGDSLGRYSFSMDLEGHVAEERVAAALIGLHRVCPLVRFMGSYPRWDRVAPHVAPGTHDADFVAARTWVERIRTGQV
ncbi:prephenate dehydratase [Georgenia satyanarayanai]|uniref:Prephenate dehydratase n=1 Tax=Georgenia satyanarayanai TaxID=860221 RepID=A0A2Y9APY9_9MICO|nr:prephenate dehydratase [Georgenia satyanarayanai]PYF97854.1 prephenate dehydratase [Georgenia satyanarayanai]SSA45428.1 prephenate dehydratase [Georgenia satyanarayanai]